MIYVLISIPFILLFNFQIIALEWSKGRNVFHFILQIFSGFIFGLSFLGPLFLSIYLKDFNISEGIRFYTSMIVFTCNMGRFFYDLVKYGKKDKK